jgi:hypothetical protein
MEQSLTVSVDAVEKSFELLGRQPAGLPPSLQLPLDGGEVAEFVGRGIVHFLPAPFAVWIGNGRAVSAKDADGDVSGRSLSGAENERQQDPYPVADQRNHAEGDDQDDQTDGELVHDWACGSLFTARPSSWPADSCPPYYGIFLLRLIADR